MLLFVLVINFLDTVAFDLPLIKNKLGQPEVAFERKKLSKYFDLVEQKWKDTNHGYRQTTYNQMVKFCRTMYPDLDVQDVQQGSYQMLSFCSVKQPGKCAEVQTMTWQCSTGVTEPTVSPVSTMSPNEPEQCVNETLRPISYNICTPVVIVAQLNHCSEFNQTLNKMFPFKSCNVTDAEGRTIDGLISADLQCCSSTKVKSRVEEPTPVFPPIITVPSGDRDKIFNPNKHTTFDPVPLPEEWCNLTGVEERREAMREETIQKMQEIYNSTGIDDAQEDKVKWRKIKEMDESMDRQVIQIYSEHFICLIDTVKSTLRYCNDFFRGLVENQKKRLIQNPEVQKWRSEVEGINNSLSQVEKDFSSLCETYIAGSKGRFNADYHSLVQRLQEIRKRIDTVAVQVKEVEDSANCVECATNLHIPTNHPVNNIPNVATEDKSDENSAKLRNQKYLIAGVSTLSCITILVAFTFFVIVVRRTLQNDLRNRKYACYPANDSILTNEQYVAFLQKNGYANPTCRLPQKYLDDHD